MALSSCSIKEDRSACPCELNLDYSRIRSDERIQSEPRRDSLLVSVRGFYNAIVRVSDYPQYHTVSIPRTSTHLSCYLGMSEGRLHDGRTRLIIPLGEDSDRLFSFHRDLYLKADSEEEYITPVLCCEYTKIVLEFDSDAGSISEQSSFLVAQGSTCGMELQSGKPIRGEFSHVMEPYGEKSWCFDMPRQDSRDISVSVRSRGSGTEMFTVALAEELDSAGYDWGAKSLPPLVFVRINAQNLPVDVKIIDWDEAIYFNYTL